MVTRRLNDSSSPMMNNRNTTPSSAMAPSPRSSETVIHSSGGIVPVERAEAVRAEHGAGDEEAEDGAELEALTDRHEHGGRGEDDHRLAIDGEICAFRRHFLPRRCASAPPRDALLPINSRIVPDNEARGTLVGRQRQAALSRASMASSAASAVEPSGPPACAMSGRPPPPLPPSGFGAGAHQIDGAHLAGEVVGDADDDAELAVRRVAGDGDDAGADLASCRRRPGRADPSA